MSWTARGGGGHIARKAIAAAIVIVAVGAVAYYVFNDTSAATATVTGGTVHLLQGTDAQGGWLGPSTINFTSSSPGFPVVLGAGSTFTISIPLASTDRIPHTLESVTVAPPFRLAGTSATLPAPLPPGTDAELTITLHAPGHSGKFVFDVTLTIR